MNVRFDAHSYSIWWLLAWLLVFQLMESSAVYTRFGKVYLNGEPEIFKARAVIRGTAGSRSINGALNFEQFSVDGPVIISGTIRGLKPGLHGLHIHLNGNLSNSCKAAGPHFNPFLGDLGNIESYPGNPARAFVYHVDSVISLAGPSDYSVLYRAVVIHSKRDDLGRGGHADSLATGDSGQRVACGLIVTV